MAELPGKKTKYVQTVKCKWNFDQDGMICVECFEGLVDWCEYRGLKELPKYDDKEFFVPVEWFEANQKIGCQHGREQKILKSFYVKD